MAVSRCTGARLYHKEEKNDFKMASNKCMVLQERMHKLNMCKFPGHNTNTKWNKQLEQFWIYIDIDHDVGCEQSWWMKGICLMWSRCRHYSPSLPDLGPTQGGGPTGI